MKPRAKLPKSGGAKATKPANKGKPKAKVQPPVQAREEDPHATISEEAATTTSSTEVTAPAGDRPECPSAVKADEEAEQSLNDGGSGEEGEKDSADGAQTRARMLQRHKQELREVKKARGKSKAEVKKMEHELRAKQQAELHALDRELAALRPKRVPKPLSPGVNDKDSDDDDTGSSDDDATPSPGEKGPTPDSGEQKGPKKPSRAARRKQKREAEDREREKRIEEERRNAGPSAKALEIRRLMDKLGPKGLRITEVAADGNCLYSAVGDQIKRSALSGPQSIAELRRLAADYILAHPDDFLPFLIAGEELPPGGLKKYCDELKRDGVWGGQLELRALAQSLKVPIVVHSADAPELKMGEEFQRDPLQLTFHRHYYALGEHYNSVAAAGEVSAE